MSLVVIHGPPIERASVESRLKLLGGAFLAEYTGHTANAYRADLHAWFGWCLEHDVDPLAAQRPHLQVWIRTLEAARAPATVARRLSTVCGFYRYCLAEGFIDRSPAAHMRRPKVPSESQTLGLDKPELVALLDVAERAGPLEHALVCLLSLNGLRVSEVCATDCTDLAAQRGHRTLTVTRKGGYRAVVPLAPRTAAAVEEHRDGRQSGPLMVTWRRQRLDRNAAAYLVAKLAGEVTDKKISPHSLRHTFVTLALDAGVSLRDVQDAAGHRDPATTIRYDRARHNLDRHATYAVAQFVA